MLCQSSYSEEIYPHLMTNKLVHKIIAHFFQGRVNYRPINGVSLWENKLMVNAYRS
jgi:hypothetical protein